MNQLIDLCGIPIQFEKIKSFRLIKRDCLFYPAYQETEDMGFSVFARLGTKAKKKFRFVKMVPFGAMLSDKEKPVSNGYAIKSFGEAAALDVLADVRKMVENVANLATDLLRIDTSGSKELRALTHGRRLVIIRMRDIPAKVMFLSGKVSDVYKNDPIYAFLGEPIAPTIVTIPTLVVTVDKETHVFFGNGIDLENAETTYHQLFEAYKQFHEWKERQKLTTASHKSNLSLPKLSIPSIKFQSPFVLSKNEGKKHEIPKSDASYSSSSDDTVIQELSDGHSNHIC